MASQTTVVTGKVRLSFVNLFEPRAGMSPDGTPQPPKYSVQVLIPKSDTATVQKLRAAEKKTAEEGKARFKNGKVPPNLKSILHDGDTESDLEEYPERAGHYYMSVTANEKYPPALVEGPTREEITDRSSLYSGCYAKVSLNPFVFNVSGNQGVSFGLRAVWKVADGEGLGGAGGNSAKDFEGEEWEGDDAESLI